MPPGRNKVPGRKKQLKRLVVDALEQGYQSHFHRGHTSLMVAFKGPNVILGLYKCDYSLTVKRELGSAAR